MRLSTTFDSTTQTRRKTALAFTAIAAATTVFGCQTRAQETVTEVVPNAPAATVVVSSTKAGRTPGIIGYNMGDNFPGSNVSSWLRYSELNGARVWWPQNVWAAEPARWNGANTLARFEAARAQLRADPSKAFDWKAYESGIARHYKGTPEGTIGASFPISELRKMDANVLIMMSTSTKKHAFQTATGAPDWFGRWNYWRGVYANAFYLARTYDIERFQLFNEPDHKASIHIEPPDYVQRLQIGSDAVQAAVSDVNRIHNKSLQVKVSAPVTAGMMVFKPRSGRTDTRDSKVGWGELSMGIRGRPFAGQSAQNKGVFGVYAFQNYGRTPSRIATDLPKLREFVTQANGGAPMPMIVSEMNVSTAADFSKKPETLDSAGYYDAFGGIASAYANAGIDEVYVFRLTQTDNLGNGQVKKNGTHIIDNNDPLRDITASTRGAEVVRLWMRGFKGGRARLAEPTTTGTELHTLAALDERDGTRTLMLSNMGGARTVNMDFSAWNLPAGALVLVEEVSATHHGAVSRALASPISGKWALPMEANSVALITVRPNLSGTARALVPVTIAGNRLSVAAPVEAGGRILLSLRATAKTPMRARIYGGTGALSQSELLGQVMLGANTTELFVDATRYVAADKNPVFRVVPDDAKVDAKTIQVEAAQLQVFGAIGTR